MPGRLRSRRPGVLGRPGFRGSRDLGRGRVSGRGGPGFRPDPDPSPPSARRSCRSDRDRYCENRIFRPTRQTSYVHIDALFGEAGRNVIDWDLIEQHFKGLMRVALSVREGKGSSVLLLRRLRSGSRKNAHYAAFREVGRVIRTIQLLRYLTDPQMRRRVTAATNKVEAYNGFSEWGRFGNRGVITDNDPVEQEKAVKFNALLSNCLIFHNTLDIAQAVRELQAEGWKVEPEDLAEVSPYLTEKIMRFGEYSTHELDLAPEAYEPHLDVDFAKLDPQDQAGPER
ncbi:Tn3 family transposase [Kitasatospora mediocidica]|uniref:Tn3 family transposase n=1 Tax=Kitasatospora mediocidica TaxID=58352 RepID=UPI000A041A06|nr:Tn3 family transposase [Kitasatospora mediocidica]